MKNIFSIKYMYLKFFKSKKKYIYKKIKTNIIKYNFYKNECEIINITKNLKIF